MFCLAWANVGHDLAGRDFVHATVNQVALESLGMISEQVPTSLCMQDKLIMHSCYCFVEQYVHPRESNIYMAYLYL